MGLGLDKSCPQRNRDWTGRGECLIRIQPAHQADLTDGIDRQGPEPMRLGVISGALVCRGMIGEEPIPSGSILNQPIRIRHLGMLPVEDTAGGEVIAVAGQRKEPGSPALIQSNIAYGSRHDIRLLLMPPEHDPGMDPVGQIDRIRNDPPVINREGDRIINQVQVDLHRKPTAGRNLIYGKRQAAEEALPLPDQADDPTARNTFKEKIDHRGLGNQIRLDPAKVPQTITVRLETDVKAEDQAVPDRRPVAGEKVQRSPLPNRTVQAADAQPLGACSP